MTTQPSDPLAAEREMVALLRPIIGIEYRSGLEAFDIMADRFRSYLKSKTSCLATSSAPVSDWIEEAIRLAEIGEYLYDHQSFSAGNGYDEPREFSINWEWQQSKPGEYGQGALLSEAAKWHDELVADGLPTVASKLRALLSTTPPMAASSGVEGWKLVPVEPTDALLLSMAIRYDHGIGVPGYYDQPIFGAENVGHEARLRSTLTTMRQLHEEVVGTGFYKSAAPPPPVVPVGKVNPEALGDVSSLIAARCSALPGKLIDCPVCGAVDNERARRASVAVPVSEERVEAAALAMGRDQYGAGDTEEVFLSWFPHSDEAVECRGLARMALTAALAVPDKGVQGDQRVAVHEPLTFVSSRDPGTHQCGSQPEADVGATAALAPFEKMVAGEDGWSEWRRPLPGYLMKCCDCGLVHEMDFAVVRQGAALEDGYYESEPVDDPTVFVMFRARRADGPKGQDGQLRDELESSPTTVRGE